MFCYHRVKAFNIFNKSMAVWAKMLILLVVAASLSGCGFLSNRSGKSYVVKGKRYHIMASASAYKEKGLASWYGEPFHGRKTASGEVYDMNLISAAHKTLPLHTWVEVRNLDNKKTILCRINDRGPFINDRIIDLSRKAAEELGIKDQGVARVYVRAVKPSKAMRKTSKDKRYAKVSAGQ